MTFIIDTNVAIDLVNNEPGIAERIAALPRRVILSVVTQVELAAGLLRAKADLNLRARIESMLATFSIADFTPASAAAYETIIQVTGFLRPRVLDRMIAAQALVSDATLITQNGKDFSDIPGLTLEIW